MPLWYLSPIQPLKNLFGSIEKKPVMGSIVAGFYHGSGQDSVLRANGGYLVIQIEPLLTSAYIWEMLKTTLRNSSLRIEDGPEQSAQGMPSLKPQPVKIDLKVILVGGVCSVSAASECRFPV